MHVSVIHIIISHLYLILNTCLHVCFVLCSDACWIAKISSPSKLRIYEMVHGGYLNFASSRN
jgi:hypothetical protein